MNPVDAEKAVRHWLEVMVVGENLCPFAARPLRDGRVRIAVCPQSDDDAIYRFLLREVEHLFTCPPQQVETTLVAVTRGLEDFDHYLGMLAELEDALLELRLDGTL